MRDEVVRLNREFEAFARAEYARWSANDPEPRTNRHRNVVDEMIENAPRVQARHARWIAHIDPISSAWWRERGYKQIFEGDRARVRKINQTA